MRRLLRLGLWFAVLVIAGIVSAILIGAYAEHRDNPLVPSGRWLAWAIQTSILLWAALQEHRRNWNERGYWLAIAGWLLIHTVAYAIVLEVIVDWRPVWFLPISIVEYLLVMAILDRLGFGHRIPRDGEST
jgi:hypothetical protein